jgi:hypothetical protein
VADCIQRQRAPQRTAPGSNTRSQVIASADRLRIGRLLNPSELCPTGKYLALLALLAIFTNIGIQHNRLTGRPTGMTAHGMSCDASTEPIRPAASSASRMES